MRRVLVGALAAGSLLVPAPARAADCAPPGQVTAAKPWAQQYLGADRIAPLATGSGILVAVVDSGVDGAVPQLAGRVEPGKDFAGTGGDGAQDCTGHGTGVAGLIAARAVTGVGFRGLAPGVRILPLRVTDPGRASATGLVEAIRYAADSGAKVINLSLVDADSPALRAAIQYAQDRDAVVVAAAGNNETTGKKVPYPAAYDGVIGVGAIDAAGLRYAESQTGSYVDLVAPGAGVLTLARQSGHTTVSGTSFATAFVSASAALIRQYRPGLRASEVTARLLATADPAPGGRRSDAYGHGIVSPYRALTEELASGGPAVAAPVPEVSRVPVSEAAARTQRLGLILAAAGVALAALIAAAAAVLPRGRRRSWRPGRLRNRP
ncbi:type VII secretion-associated serine protease mycosin [Longispora albida]|uniref:type VII secretion-associated serine protease mycosin n=1 Tax=Longispora albida TaxID=203523 RepID=UPI00036F7440|nr:type VII secretion-associated serine protease mycosin [Longispora albida]